MNAPRNPFLLDGSDHALIEELTEKFGHTHGTYRHLLTIIDKLRKDLQLKDYMLTQAQQQVDNAQRILDLTSKLAKKSKPP